jgi:hypothetical protein
MSIRLQCNRQANILGCWLLDMIVAAVWGYVLLRILHRHSDQA